MSLIGGEPSFPTTGGRPGSLSAGHRLGAVPLIRARRPLGEAAFNQGPARSSSEVLDKVSAAAERETPPPPPLPAI